MRKDVLTFSLLAASMPMTALADAVVSDLDKDTAKEWAEKDANDKFTLEGTLLVSDGTAMTQTIAALVQGKYKLTLAAGSTNVLVNGKEPASNVVEFELKDGEKNLVFSAKEANKPWKLGIEKFEVVFDFATINKALTDEIGEVTRLIGALEYEFSTEKDALLMEASKISDRIVAVADNGENAFKAYVNEKLYTSPNEIAKAITALEEKYNVEKGKHDAAKANRGAYDTAIGELEALQQNLDAKKTELGFDGADKYIKEHASVTNLLTKMGNYIKDTTAALKTANEAGNAASVKIDETGFVKDLADFATAFKTVELDHKDYNDILTEIAKVEAEYNAAVQDVINKIKDTPDVYADSRQAATTELTSVGLKAINEVKALNGTAESHDKATENKGDNTTSLSNISAAIKATLKTHVDKAENQMKNYDLAVADVATQQTDLDNLKKDINPVIANFQSRVDAIQKLINDLKAAVATQNEKHTIVEYYADGFVTSEKAVADAIKKLNDDTRNPLANYRVTGLLNTATANLKKNADAVNALASNYKNAQVEYKANGKYAKVVEDITASINKCTEDWGKETDKVAKEAAYKTRISSVETQIAKLKTDAEGALKNYETYFVTVFGNGKADAEKVEGYEDKYKALEAVVTDPNVIYRTSGKTYAEELAVVQKDIAQVTTDFKAAYAKTNADHVAAMAELVNSKLNAGILTKISTLSNDYADDKIDYDSQNLSKAVKAMQAAVQKLIENSTKKLNTAASGWSSSTVGKKYNEVVSGKVSGLQGEIAAQQTLADAEFAKLASVETLAQLTKINDALVAIDKKVDALITEVNGYKTTFEANEAKEAEADAALSKINDLINGKGTIKKILDMYGDPTKKTEFETAVDKLNSTRTTLQSDIKTSDAAETLVEDWKDKGTNPVVKGFGSRLSELEEEVNALRDKADATKANYDAKERTQKAYNEVKRKVADVEYTGFNVLLTVAENAIKAAKAEAQTYYNGVLNGYRTEVNNLQSEITTCYSKDESVAKEGAINNAINNLADNIAALKGLVEANDASHTAQVALVNKAQKEWQAAYTDISSKDESSQLGKYQELLGALQLRIDAASETVTDNHAKGEAVKGDQTKELEKIRTEIVNLKKTWEEGYNQAIWDDNYDYHTEFIDVANLAYNEYVAAVELFNKFQGIQSVDFKAEVSAILEAHKDIYQKATDLTKLKEDEFAAYGATKPGELFDENEDFLNKAKTLRDEIESRMNSFANSVNSAAVKSHTDAKNEVQSKYEDAIATLSEYTEPVREKAFGDVLGLLNSLNDLSTADLEFAVKLDALLQKVEGVDQMLIDGREPAAVQEWETINKEAVALKTTHEEKMAKFEYLDNTTDYAANYAYIVSEYLTYAQNLAAGNEGNLYDIMGELHKYMEDFEKEATGMFEDAEKASGKHAANKTAYDALSASVKNAFAAFNKAQAHADGYCITNFTGLDGVEAGLNDLSEKIKAGENTGACATNNTTWSGDIASYVTTINESYVAAELAEYTTLFRIVNVLKNDYNEAMLRAEGNAETIKQIEAYDAIIKKLAADLETHHGNSIKTGEEALLPEKIQEGYIALEVRMAEVRSGLNKISNAILAADILDALNGKIEGVVARQATSVALAGEYVALQDEYATQLAAWDADIKAVQAEIQNCVDKETVIFYEDKLHEVVDALVGNQVYAELETAIKNGKAKFDANEAAHDRMLSRYNTLKAEWEAAVAEIEAYENVTLIPVREHSMFTYNEQQLVKAYDEMEKAYKEVTLASSSQLNEEYIADYTWQLRREYAGDEYTNISTRILDDANDLWSKVINKVGGNRYLPEHQDKIESLKGDVIGMCCKLNRYIRCAKDDYTRYSDVDLNPYLDTDGTPLYCVHVNFMDDCVPMIQERIKMLETLLAELVEYEDTHKYVLGDIDADGSVFVNDYNAVLGLALKLDGAENEKAKMDAIDYARADVNEDEADFINVGDVTQIANIINPVEGSSVRAMRLARRNAVHSNDVMSVSLNANGQLMVDLNSATQFVGAQFDIVLPAGVTLMNQSLGSRAAEHGLYINDLGNGKHRVIIASFENVAFTDGEALVVFDVAGNVSVEKIQLTGAMATEANARVHYVAGFNDTATGINGVNGSTSIGSKIYSVGGQILNTLKKGVNIIRNANGSSTKVIKK